MSAFFVGLALGVFVAAQPGPVSFLLVRTAAHGGRLPALMVGVAAACVDTIYAALGATGLVPIQLWPPARLVLGLFGGAVLVLIGVRTLWVARRVRLGLEIAEGLASGRRAFATGFAATVSNPLTVASWAAIFAAAAAGGATDSFAGAVALVLGIGVASFCWFTVLTLLTTAALLRVGTRWTCVIGTICGLGLVVAGTLLGARGVLTHS